MIKFLTTQGINYHLEELLKNANSKIILVSPYFKLQRRIKEILRNKKQQGIEIFFVCRINDLKEPLEEYSTQIFDSPNLGAKCYMNENEAILTSLNLYEFSQQNNEEMGIYVKNQNDGVSIYKDMLLEVARLCKNRIPNQTTTTTDNLSLEIGTKYSATQLQQVFNFSYQSPAGIKETASGNIVLFSNTGSTPYTDKKAGNIIYYQGQNTGEGEQKLIYGNKLLYYSYGNSKIKIFLFENYTYAGEYTVVEKPYLEQGKWIFPLSKK
jgi:hypothetical protein